MVELKRFSGMMDTDSKEDFISPSSHKYARNLRFYGTQQGLRAENIKGNVLVANSNLPSVGVNQCAGAFFDPVKQRILWFNYNSEGQHGLFNYSIQTGVVTRLFQCGVNSATDILRLSLDYPVHSASIIYRPEADGDLFYFTDGNAADDNRPRYFNLDTITTLSPFTEDMINAAKNAPLEEPAAVYLDDATRTSNNIRKQLFQFAYRWKYKNGEFSTMSPFSKVGLPINGYDVDTQNDPTLNNNIQVIFRTGGEDFQAVEIFVRVNEGASFGIWSSVITLDRDDYSFNADTVYWYYFYNDGIYIIAADVYISNDPAKGELYYSFLPDIANTLELLNGNVIIYGGLTDGYDAFAREDIDVIVGSGIGSADIPSFSFAYSGAHDFTALVGATIVVGTTYHIEFTYSSGAGGDASPKSVNYVTIGGDTQNSIVNSIAALLNGNNIGVTNLGAGYMRVITTTGLGTITNVITTVSTAGTAAAAAAWKPSCQERLGLIYFDDRGKTNGVIYFPQDADVDTNVFDTNTPDFTVSSNVVQVPYLTGSINHTPPTWAEEYQWVRVNMTPKFLQWVTNDYQADSDFLYLCIQNLLYTQSKTSGYVPSYEFVKGDRVKVLAKYDSATGFFTPYNIQLDMEILGTVERTMTSPASTGLFIKVARPTTFPSLAYSSNILIELYTPFLRSVASNQIFFEWGERYQIYEYTPGVRMHAGQITNQTPTQPATFQWFDGDIYFKEREFYLDVNATATNSVFMFDANYSDYFTSQVNSNGRGWAIDENAKRDYNPVLVRWGKEYQQDTNVNQLPIFYPQDQDTYDRARGDIRRFKARDRILRIFQERGCGQVGIYSKFIQDNAGVQTLTTTDEIIVTNNIQYYQGFYGIGEYPTNLCSSTIADYFSDVITGREIRLSYDGMTDLGFLYKGQFTLAGYITPFNKTLTQSNGAIAKIIKFWDSFEGEAHTITQAGTGNGTTAQNIHYSFNEPRNAFCSYYDYIPEWGLSANDTIFTWSNGQLYIHNGGTYCNFYGTQYGVILQLVFNQNLLEKKTWMSINQISDSIWPCAEIYTSTKSYGSQRQQSSLVLQEFTLLEGNASSSFRRDNNSYGGKLNGQFLKGNWMAITMRINSTPDLVFLSDVSVLTKDSALTMVK